MIAIAIKRLEFLCDKIPSLMLSIENEIFSAKPIKEKWSKKQILGHLIDSATNNHQRFVRAQFEDSPEIYYDQNKWIDYSFYQEIGKQQLIEFWTIYNKQLVEIMKRIPSERLPRTCKGKDGGEYTLEFLIIDYVDHLEHHLKQIVEY